MDGVELNTWDGLDTWYVMDGWMIVQEYQSKQMYLILVLLHNSSCDIVFITRPTLSAEKLERQTLFVSHKTNCSSKQQQVLYVWTVKHCDKKFLWLRKHQWHRYVWLSVRGWYVTSDTAVQ